MSFNRYKGKICSLCKTDAKHQLYMGYHGYDGYCHWICYVKKHYPWIDVSQYEESASTNETNTSSKNNDTDTSSKQNDTNTSSKNNDTNTTTQEESRQAPQQAPRVEPVNTNYLHYHNNLNLNDPWQARVAASSP